MKNLIYLILVLFLVSCNSDDDSTQPTIQTGPIAFTEIHKFYLGGSGAQGILQSNVIIDNSSDWNSLLNQMDTPPYGPISNNFSQTTIDFNQNMVIAVFRDVMPTVQFVEITEVMENLNDITITIQDSNNVNGFTAITQPYHIIMIPKTNKPFIFQ